MSDLVLQTDMPELTLRELTLADEDAYFALVERNREHLGGGGDYAFEAAASRRDIRTYFASPWDNNVRLGLWCERHLIGRVDLNPINPPNWVIGYWLDHGWTGRGLMTAACRVAIEHAKDLGVAEIYAGITNGNSSSVAVVSRLGFDHVQDVEDRSRWRLPLIDDPPPPVMA